MHFDFTSMLLQRMEEVHTKTMIYKYTNINHCLPDLCQTISPTCSYSVLGKI